MLSACSQKKIINKVDIVIGIGQMPWLAKDNKNNVHLVYGSGDSIMYSCSADNGNTFAKPAVVAVLPGAYSFAMRGPQITATDEGVIVTACTTKGDIFSFYKQTEGKWTAGGKVNDADTTAKEGLMALGSDGKNTFAAWLDLRENNRNKIYGARSNDGGKTWSNVMIYKSPDFSVCECCKPSVVVKGSNIYVMFRNWLDGNRDLYLLQSTDGGNSFGQAQKLGNGNWKLNGCPMDGGGMAINENMVIQTVWRRKANIYASSTGEPEKVLGKGRSCTIESVGGKNVYAWTENGDIVITKPDGKREVLGKGSQPVIKALDSEHIVCLWENDNKIHATVFAL